MTAYGLIHRAHRSYNGIMAADAAHHRRSIRLAGYDYSQPGAYFVTIVTAGRKCLFGAIVEGDMRLSPQGQIAQACWQEIPGHFPHVELGAYVIMPNHVHGIIVLHQPGVTMGDDDRATMKSSPVGAQHAAPLHAERNVTSGSIGAIVRSFKSAVTHLIHEQFGGSSPLWQRNYYEHIIRNDGEWQRIHLYIESNPVLWAQDDENPDAR